jgi:hypothetical protein
MDRILVLESDPAVQKALKRLFVAEGHSKAPAEAGKRSMLPIHFLTVRGSDIGSSAKVQVQPDMAGHLYSSIY